MNYNKVMEIYKDEKECALCSRPFCAKICKSCVYRHTDEELKEFYDIIEDLIDGVMTHEDLIGGDKM